MKIQPGTSVLSPMSRVLSTLLVAVLLASCTSKDEVVRHKRVPAGEHRDATAVESDYLIEAGATLHLQFARECRFYVQQGGRRRLKGDL